MQEPDARTGGRPPGPSLRRRLPLLISGLVLAVLGVVVAAAYQGVVSTLETGAGDRARSAARQVNVLLTSLTGQSLAGLQRVAPAARTYVDRPGDATRAELLEAIAPLAPSATRRVTVWRRGERVLALPEPDSSGAGAPGLLPLPSGRPGPGIGPIQADGDRAFADVTVEAPSSGNGAPAAISLRSVLSITPPDLFGRLIGDDARILLGNREGAVWTDLAHVVTGPPVDRGSDASQQYRSRGAGRIGASSAMDATPWVIWVEFPRETMVASATTFLRRMMVLVIGVGVAGILLARWFATSITAPLATMTEAAEAMAGGDYTARVDTRRSDEIGRLGAAFNAMRDDVARRLDERQRALDLLTASEGRYRALFDHAPDGILIADGGNHVRDANPGVCRMLGYTRDELVGMSTSRLVTADQRPHVAEVQAAVAAGEVYHREWRLERRDGSVFEADVITTAMPDGHRLAMVRDVTERNRAVEAVLAAEERMRFALESAGLGVWELDLRTGEVRWSEILEAQHGLAPGAFAGTFDAFLALVHPEDRERVREVVDRASRSGADFATEHRIVRPDGAVRWISGAGRMRLDAAGAPMRGIGISADVTERHSLEAQFQQAQKMEAVGRLAGGVAHDFNNLLTAILGYCEMLLEDLRPEDPIRYEIAEIQKAGQGAASLTRQLLAFSRKQIIEPRVLDVNDVVRGVQSLLRRLISEDIEVAVTLDPAPQLVNADRGQIEQVIMNLAVNARDAMPDGGRLAIATGAVDLDKDYAAAHLNVSPGPYVMLSVTDTGQGMSADVQAHLFEPFFTTKEAGKGTGLGLATVHGVVTRSGGTIGVYSEVGRGTAFTIYLPRVEDAVTDPQGAEADGAGTRGGGQTVLVVDDAEGLRELLSRGLKRQGYRVLVAEDAARALTLVEAHPDIDVLLTDVVMPGASGPELTGELLRRRPGLKVIYMSGYTEDAIVHHGVLKPGIAFLHKPFTAETLGRKILEVLARA
ncbi:MAG: PAS domain S-box protein [Vicinamibacterales bacterium]